MSRAAQRCPHRTLRPLEQCSECLAQKRAAAIAAAGPRSAPDTRAPRERMLADIFYYKRKHAPGCCGSNACKEAVRVLDTLAVTYGQTTFDAQFLYRTLDPSMELVG